MADNYLCFSAWVVPEGLLWSFCFHCSSIWHTLYSSTVWAHFWGLSISMWMCSVRHSVYGNALKLPPEKLWAPSSLLLSSSLLYIHLYRQLYVWGISAADSLGWPRDKNHPKRPPPHNVIKGQFWGQDNWPIRPPQCRPPCVAWIHFGIRYITGICLCLQRILQHFHNLCYAIPFHCWPNRIPKSLIAICLLVLILKALSLIDSLDLRNVLIHITKWCWRINSI